MSSADVSDLAQPKPLRLNGGRSGVLLFHGLSSTPLELQFLARGLQRAGHTVHVPIIEGYSFGVDAAQHRRVDHWVTQAMAEVDAMRAQCDTVVVGGLCVGASLALAVAALRAEHIDGVMALSLAMTYDGWGNPFITRLLPLARYVPLAGRICVPERSPFGVKDERMRAWIDKQMRLSGRSVAGAASLRVADLLRARHLVGMVRRSMRKIDKPLLLVHAKDDECATPRSAFEVAQGVSTTQVRCVLLSDSFHMISIDREKERVLGEMLQFLQHHIQRTDQGRTARASGVVSLFGSQQGKST